MPFFQTDDIAAIGGATDIFYYHTNHLGSTAYVTDQSQNITQGFLYAPFGEITTEYAPLWQNGTLPKYAFNAKELDEETGMYYYEARYYKPPVFTSRDPMMDQKPWITPYHYCSNNPIKRIDPNGKKDRPFNRKKDKKIKTLRGTATPIFYKENGNGELVFTERSKKAYNCHSMAWHQSQGDPDPAPGDLLCTKTDCLPKWDNNPADDIKQQNARQLGKDEDNVPGDIVIYYTDENGNGQYDDGELITHSATVKIVDDEGYTTVVIGKRGERRIAENHPDAPRYYKKDENRKATSRAYFRRPDKTDTPAQE